MVTRLLKIPSIPHLYRNVKRWGEILSVLSKYGLADWLAQTNIEFAKNRLKDRDGEAIARHTREARIRLTLVELGPTFIKLGQLMSTRPDIVGVELAEELTQLQTSTPPDSPEQVRAMVEIELGEPLEDLFAEFDLTPIASASIGQVHRARLKTGERVVVKVQHTGLDSKVNEDLDVLAGLAQLAEHVPELQPYRPSANFAEMARTLRRELDFGREERNLMQFASLFKDNPSVCIPRPYTEFCTGRVLTMEMIDGLPLSQPALIDAAGIDREEVARRGAELYLEMIFTHGFYHADPHPGNIVLLPGNVIGLIDWGMVGRIDEKLREDIEEMLLAIVNHDTHMLTMLIKRIGQVPQQLDEQGLSSDVADFVGHYSTQNLDQFDLSGALTDMIHIIRRWRITLPTQVAMIIKVLVTLEGTARLLTPRFSLMEVMQPFHRRMILQRLSPMRQARKLRRMYVEVERLAEVLPERLMQIFDQVQSGKFDVHLDHRGLGPSVNRIVLCVLASSLFLGSSLLLANDVPPVLFSRPTWFGLHNLSILGLMGCFTSILIGFRLLHSINKSGHLDHRESNQKK